MKQTRMLTSVHIIGGGGEGGQARGGLPPVLTPVIFSYDRFLNSGSIMIKKPSKVSST